MHVRKACSFENKNHLKWPKDVSKKCNRGYFHGRILFHSSWRHLSFFKQEGFDSELLRGIQGSVQGIGCNIHSIQIKFWQPAGEAFNLFDFGHFAMIINKPRLEKPTKSHKIMQFVEVEHIFMLTN